jgi:hypothetical protein
MNEPLGTAKAQISDQLSNYGISSLKITVSWFMTPYKLIDIYLRFRGTDAPSSEQKNKLRGKTVCDVEEDNNLG